MNFPNLPIRFTFANAPAENQVIKFFRQFVVCFILTEAQCTAVNMLLCFRCHWPHRFLFIVALRLSQYSALSSRTFTFQNLHPPNLNLGIYPSAFVSCFSPFCVLLTWLCFDPLWEVSDCSGSTGCGSVVTPDSFFDPVFLSSSFTNVNDQI